MFVLPTNWRGEVNKYDDVRVSTVDFISRLESTIFIRIGGCLTICVLLEDRPYHYSVYPSGVYPSDRFPLHLRS